MQKFVAQHTESGRIQPYCVARINPQDGQYVPLRGEEYSTLQEAEDRAHELNQEQNEE